MRIRKHISNLFGWRTKRKIVIFESDDWGSVRTRSQKGYKSMLNAGLDVDQSNFTKFDCLESNQDLENFFEVLARHKDSKGNPVVFTPMTIVANPDFERIKASGFESYFYEPITATYEKYPAHDRVHELWLEGIKNRVFVPALHGREHLNVAKWMKALQEANEGVRLAFDAHSFGAAHYQGTSLPEHLAAFDPNVAEEIDAYPEILETAGKLFEDLFNDTPKHFIASNSPEPKSLEKVLKSIGVQYLSRYKFQKYPLGNNKFSREFNWLGKRNKFDQIVLTRNGGFEPSSDPDYDWVDHCLSDIAIAFKWGKPAVISSHRVNYVGYVDPQNATHGLKALDKLLAQIKKHWEDVEFMTAMELGDLVRQN